MVLKNLFRRDPAEDGAQRLYVAMVGQARHPALFARHGVPDSIDGRFDSVALHAFLVLNRLKREDGELAASLAQHLVDAFIEDMDRSVREMGVGDMGVSRRVKQMAQALYGRAAAYEAAVGEADDASLRSALERNLYAACTALDPAALDATASYVRMSIAALAAQPLSDIADGKIQFPKLEAQE
ncbi:MAG: ubiquinol-cytochrome C chaperone [Alphaproteobacteria bacterium]|nr:ubiquinol-cytochrome C chaperone [Alphaproteobacteria bacterium]